MHTEAVQATTAVFVLLSSSLATVQFAVLEQHIWHYALWYGLVVMAATLVGQWLCDVAVRRYKRTSAITLSIAGLVLASLIALLIVGFKQVHDDIRLGKQQWFSTARLCAGSAGILAVDIAPAERWPTDLPRTIALL